MNSIVRRIFRFSAKLLPSRLLDKLFALAKEAQNKLPRFKDKRTKTLATLGLVSATVLTGIFTFHLLRTGPTYELGVAKELLPASSQTIADLVSYDSKTESFTYNSGYTPASTGLLQAHKPAITAVAHEEASKGITVSDPKYRTDLTLKPNYEVLPGKQDDNRIIYPLKEHEGWLVYGMHSNSVKEDVILTESPGDELVLEYTLVLEDGMEANIEADGSIGIYGNPLLLSEISTSTDADAELLKEARKNTEKNTLLFSLPAPFVVEMDKQQSNARSNFELDGTTLQVITTGLDDATYPLSIDPSIYVETAEKFMRGNNETNVDFDIANTLIQKGETTGARFDSLSSTIDLPQNRWGHDTAVAGGYIYTVGGNDGTSNQSNVYWAKFNTTNNTLSSPNPGNGACSSWCTDSDYNLPNPRIGHTLTTYNGYLYSLGGEDASCTTANGTGNNGVCDTVYVAKLGANGEPQLWHPTDDNEANWVYWYRDADLSSPRSNAAAVPYNNRLYLLGGKTDAASGGVSTSEYADLRPTGTLSSWTTTGTTALPSVRFGHDAHAYNDYIYLVGGNSNGTLQNSVQYIKLNDDGTMSSSWSAANSFAIARSDWGGQFSTISGGYLYISGGCSAIDAEGECTSAGITDGGAYQSNGTGTSVELASINADGSVGFWGTITNITNTRIGYTLTSWRNAIYSIGGCSAQNTTTGACSTTTDDSLYGVVNEDGDGSTVSTSESSGTAPCSGADPFNCSLPSGSTVGNMLNATAIMNGYLYIIGGCTNDTCSSVSGNTIYSAIDSDGQLRRPASCPGGTITDSFCVDTTDPISGGVAAAGTAVFGGRIYVVGGQDSSGLKGNIYHVEVNNDGSLSGAWNSQTFSAVDATSVSYTFAHARANPTQASTYPGNLLYIFGGCSATSGGVDCTTGSNTGAVYKCNIQSDGSLEESDTNDCTTTGQLQIGTVPGASSAGLALHSGAVYADYIYLVGGSAPGASGLDTLRYAKFDNSNNVVATAGSSWVEPTDSSSNPVEMSTERLRSSAFGYNGYLYTLGGYDSSGSGTLSDIQFAKINTSNGSLDQFKTSSISINQRWGLNVPVSNSFAYVIGGCTAGSSPTCTSRTSTIQTFQIYNNGSGAPANYTSAANLFSTDRFGNSAAISGGYAYVAGGCIGTINCDNATNIVEYAPLNDDGSFGTWASTTALPDDRVNGHMEAVGGTLYYMGGENDAGTAQSTIYYATPASNGTISSWSTASGGIGDTAAAAATPRSQFSAAVWNNRIYVTGGFDASDLTTDTVFISPQLNSGGNIAANSWTSGTSFNTARDGLTTIAYANNLYVLGGHDGINYLSDVQYTQINADGTLDSWSYTTSLPRNVSNADGFAANGYMYIYGGKQSDINCTNNTYVAPISANTSVASGNNPTGLGSWFLTNERFSAERAYTSAVYYSGKAYLFGGSCGDLEAVPGTDVVDDDFDPALDGTMWSSTTDMAVGTTCGTLDSGNALYSTGDDTAQAITKDVDVSYGGTISFYLRIPTSGGSCDAPQAGEDLVLQYSSNSGSGWTTFATYDESNFNTATLINEAIPSVAQTPSTRFRWYIPNADNNRDQWAIDTLVINAFVTPPLLEVLEDDFDPTIDGADWASTTDMAVGTICGTIGSGNSLYSTGGNTAQAITTDVNLQYGGLVSFELRIPENSGGGCDQPQSDEDVELQYSVNAGSTWTTFATYDESDYDTPTSIATGIPQGARSSSVRFRWYNPNADSGGDQWAIDDVTIEALQPILTYTGIHRAVYTSLLAQPQVAKYSIMFDTDSDVFPNYWLLNGVDNSIGAKWQLDYRSMTDTVTSCTSPAMTTWGQTVNFGNVALGTPASYTPLNGSGTDTDCARFYYFSASVDSSQAYGYPEDITRGPTITDFTLQFTADPNKRLMHGRTFTGGLQQPLDTPVPGF